MPKAFLEEVCAFAYGAFRYFSCFTRWDLKHSTHNMAWVCELPTLSLNNPYLTGNFGGSV